MSYIPETISALLNHSTSKGKQRVSGQADFSRGYICPHFYLSIRSQPPHFQLIVYGEERKMLSFTTGEEATFVKMNLCIRLPTTGGTKVTVYTAGKSSTFLKLTCIWFLQNYTSHLIKQKHLSTEGEIFNLLKVNAYSPLCDCSCRDMKQITEKKKKEKIKENKRLGVCGFFCRTFTSSLNLFHFYSVLVQDTRIICINLIQW